MATKKDKLLASAQKALQKGQTTRAIKDYQKVIELDPKDIRSRQKLGDLCSKAGQSETALESYEVVAKHYADKGFYLKAIAVYKQMQKIDSSQLGIYAKLADLNEKQGLTGNAIAEYRNLAAQYEKNDMPGEAISILQKMKELDPDNLNVRVKIAELYAALDEAEKGKDEFLEVLENLKKSGNYEKILKLYEIFLPLFPDETDVGIGLAEAYLRTGKIDKSLKILKAEFKKNKDDKNVLQMMGECYRHQKDYENERLTLQHLLKLSAKNLGYRIKYIRACLNQGDFQRALNDLEEWKEAFFKAEKVDALKECYEKLRRKMPKDEKVARTLGLIYETTGEIDKLSDVVSSLPKEQGTELDFFQASDEEFVDDSIMSGVSDDLAEIEIAEGDLIDDQEEVPLDILEGPDELEEIEELEELEEVEELDELEEIEELEELEEVEELEGLSLDSEQEMELEIELDLDSSEDESVLEISEDDLHDGPVLDLVSALEEVEFYFQQGLLDEAETACKAILESVPDNEQANIKLAEIREKRSEPVEEEGGDFIDIAAEVMAATDEALAEDTNEFDLSADFSSKTDEEVEEISTEDAESHYNLGIAYKEMGLVDDAIAEFDKAMRNPTRLVDSLALKAMCLAETGAFEEAEQFFWAVLEQPSLGPEEKKGIQFELGLFYENFGKIPEAISVIEEVAANDPGYRNASEKLDDLKSGKSAVAEGSAGKNNKDRVSYI